MTDDRAPLSRTELAGLLTEAAQSVSGIVAAEYPTAASRSYLHPVLGPLSAGPRVVGELNDRLEGLVAAVPRPATPAGLFTLASYAAALGWLTESFTELTASVDQICTRVGIPSEPRDPAFAVSGDAGQDGEFDLAFNARELAANRTPPQAPPRTPNHNQEVLYH
ncbi:hypothetical protein ACFWGM_02430, partial [Streptomyces roseolus]|uniref:hypothetical protein n=1 Tax=Streptomyces roseolus TaxID=67358 RepID=UPI003651F1AC